MERYRVQGAAYALALERALGTPVARCVFVFARRPRRPVEREVDDLPAAIAEVVQQAHGRAAMTRRGPGRTPGRVQSSQSALVRARAAVASTLAACSG